MDYKKKYEEAIYLLKELRPKISDYYREKLDGLFPEITESKNESIRKELLEHCKKRAEMYNTLMTAEEYNKVQAWIAWLEKQGKQRPAPQWMVDFLDDDCRRNLGKTLDRDVYREMEGKLIAIKEFLETSQRRSAPEAPNEEKIDDDDTDMAKPMFKIGDWVATNVAGLVSPLKIMDVSDIEYRIEDQNGNSGVPKIDYLDSHYHLWTPDDAKDGDVMVTETKHRPFIFKGFLDVKHPFAPVAYCGIERWNLFYISSDPNWWTDDSFIPASFQEREQLLKVMHEKGYEWDPDEKELKIIDWSKHIKYEPNGPSITVDKSADEDKHFLKIHPKFKVGDKIVIKDVIGEVQITEITDGMYGTVTQFGNHLFFDINVLDREAHYATK